MKFAIQYDQTVSWEATDLKVHDVDEALEVVREVIGDDIEVECVGKDGDWYYVRYNVTTGHEAVVESDYLEEAKIKVTMVVPDAKITGGWELLTSPCKEVEFGEKQILVEDNEINGIDD